jgi:hypothetical protein
MMAFKHRSLISAVAIATFLTGLANGVLFCFTGQLHTALVGSLCIVFGLGYLMLLRIHPSKQGANARRCFRRKRCHSIHGSADHSRNTVAQQFGCQLEDSQH